MSCREQEFVDTHRLFVACITELSGQLAALWSKGGVDKDSKALNKALELVRKASHRLLQYTVRHAVPRQAVAPAQLYGL
jgi:hypothetical protein